MFKIEMNISVVPTTVRNDAMHILHEDESNFSENHSNVTNIKALINCAGIVRSE